MNELIFVKLGGSLITEKSRPYTARLDVIDRLARQLRDAREEKGFKLLTGHGGGSFPHTSAKKYETDKGFIDENSVEGFCRVHDDAARLNRIVVGALLEAGETAVSVQPSSCCVAENGRILEWYLKPIDSLLKNNMVPVVYGDAALDVKKGCCILSTEVIFEHLANILKPSRIILCGKVDGVLDSNGKVIGEITENNFPGIKGYLSGSDGIDVTGGMFHKVEMMLDLAKKGIKSEVINGEKPGNLRKSLLGEKVLGTVIKSSTPP
jgi:isopentenyl phosphate kinase